MKLLVVVVIAALASIVLCGTEKNSNRHHKTDKKWIAFKAKHLAKLRSFKTDDDEAKHYRNYVKTDNVIEENNAKYEKGESPFKLEHNHMSASSDEEKNQYTGVILPDESKPKRSAHLFFNSNDNSCNNLPTNFDWVEKGWNAPVRNQKTCGSCWAFATCGAFESAFWIKSKQFINCAPQQMVSCAKPPSYNTFACNGGWYGDAIDYVAAAGGITLEPMYPYQNANGTCPSDNARSLNKYISVTNTYERISQGDLKGLKCAIATRSPVIVCLNGKAPEFNNFKSGILQYPANYECNHAVLAVGYGVDSRTNLPFVRIKNSWGNETWGEGGYAKVALNLPNGTPYSVLLQQNVFPILPDTARQGTDKPTPTSTTTKFPGVCKDTNKLWCKINSLICNQEYFLSDVRMLFDQYCPVTCKLCIPPATTPSPCGQDNADWCEDNKQYCTGGYRINGLDVASNCKASCCTR